VDKTGRSATDARAILDDMFARAGGGIMPLGGTGELHGGHKGFGLAILVDILCAVLCGAPFGPEIADTETSSGRVSHFFGAIRIDTFRDSKAFRQDMDHMLRSLRESLSAEDAERVYYAGLKEFEHERECEELGVPILDKTFAEISAIGRKWGIDAPPTTAS
jgi:LDH2 family malate/lactate/ureidoglycolate dehydrogenase